MATPLYLRANDGEWYKVTVFNEGSVYTLDIEQTPSQISGGSASIVLVASDNNNYVFSLINSGGNIYYEVSQTPTLSGGTDKQILTSNLNTVHDLTLVATEFGIEINIGEPFLITELERYILITANSNKNLSITNRNSSVRLTNGTRNSVRIL